MISIGSVVRVAYDFQGEAENEELRSRSRKWFFPVIFGGFLGILTTENFEIISFKV